GSWERGRSATVAELSVRGILRAALVAEESSIHARHYKGFSENCKAAIISRNPRSSHQFQTVAEKRSFVSGNRVTGPVKTREEEETGKGTTWVAPPSRRKQVCASAPAGRLKRAKTLFPAICLIDTASGWNVGRRCLPGSLGAKSISEIALLQQPCEAEFGLAKSGQTR